MSKDNITTAIENYKKEKKAITDKINEYKSKLAVLFGAYSISCWIQLLWRCLLGLFSPIRCADCFTFLFFLQKISEF